ncbi:MAG: hypothetical protein ACRDBG_27445 [Waterburya sp.]
MAASFYEFLNELKKRNVIHDWYDFTSSDRKVSIEAAESGKPYVRIDELKPSGGVKRYVNIGGYQRALINAQVMISIILPARDGLTRSKASVQLAVDHIRNAPNFVCGMNQSSPDNDPYYQVDKSIRSDMTLSISYYS